MAIEQVKSFKTADGRLFTERAQAIPHDAMLTVRGLIQQQIPTGTVQMSTTDAATFIVKNAAIIRDALNKFLDAQRRAR